MTVWNIKIYKVKIATSFLSGLISTSEISFLDAFMVLRWIISGKFQTFRIPSAPPVTNNLVSGLNATVLWHGSVTLKFNYIYYINMHTQRHPTVLNPELIIPEVGLNISYCLNIKYQVPRESISRIRVCVVFHVCRFTICNISLSKARIVFRRFCIWFCKMP